MKNLLLIATLFFSISSCGQTRDQEIELILLNCLTDSYSDYGVDINKELDDLETYLIESKSLKSSSGKGYFDFYKEIVKLNEVPASIDFDKLERIYKVTPSEFYKDHCLKKISDLDSTSIANSKYSQMTLAIHKASSEGITPSKIASAIIRVLEPTDFDRPYYRAIALLTIAYSSE